MVQNLGSLSRKFKTAPKVVHDEIAKEMERTGAEIVAAMDAIKPLPEIKVGWTWGSAPKGSVTVGRVGRNEFAKISISIYATTPNGSGFDAKWFEFGTNPRFHKSGKYVGRITASPFFYPVYRANKRLIRGRISRAITRGLKKV